MSVCECVCARVCRSCPRVVCVPHVVVVVVVVVVAAAAAAAAGAVVTCCPLRFLDVFTAQQLVDIVRDTLVEVRAVALRVPRRWLEQMVV